MIKIESLEVQEPLVLFTATFAGHVWAYEMDFRFGTITLDGQNGPDWWFDELELLSLEPLRIRIEHEGDEWLLEGRAALEEQLVALVATLPEVVESEFLALG